MAARSQDGVIKDDPINDQGVDPADVPSSMGGTKPNQTNSVQDIVGNNLLNAFGAWQAANGETAASSDPRDNLYIGTTVNSAGIALSPVNVGEALSQGIYGAPDYAIDALSSSLPGQPENWDYVYERAVELAAIRRMQGKPIGLRAAIFEVSKEVRQGSGGGSGGTGGPRAFTNTQVTRTLTNESTARQILNASLSNALGRRATPAENRAFLKALNVQEKENPTKSVTKGVASESGTDAETTTTGGFDSRDFADRFARSQEGYAEYQAATTQLDNFIQALTNRRRVI